MKKGAVIWLCGLAGSGKSTLAEALCVLLRQQTDTVIYLDGDDLRDIFAHFTYDKLGRIQMAIKRAKLAKFLSNQGHIVVISTISLFNEVYTFNRANLNHYFEVFVDCNLEELKKRDQKGLYTQALAGKIQNMVGVDIPFDTPHPHWRIENHERTHLNQKAQALLDAFWQFYQKT